MTLTDVQQDAWRRTAAHIELEPAAFSMSTWGDKSDDTICGTVACAAGSAVLCQLDQDEALRWREAFFNGAAFLPRNGDDEGLSCSSRAAQLLGLTQHQADVVFENEGVWWYETLKALDLLNETQDEYAGVTLANPSEGDEPFHRMGITAKQAAEVMRAVANGEIELPEPEIVRCECPKCRDWRGDGEPVTA